MDQKSISKLVLKAGSVNIFEHLPRLSPGEYSPMYTSPSRIIVKYHYRFFLHHTKPQYKDKVKINFLKDKPTFAKGGGVFRPLTVAKACHYWFSMQPVALGTRKVACSIVFRRGRAGVRCYLTISWRQKTFTADNCTKNQNKLKAYSVNDLGILCRRKFLNIKRCFPYLDSKVLHQTRCHLLDKPSQSSR